MNNWHPTMEAINGKHDKLAVKTFWIKWTGAPVLNQVPWLVTSAPSATPDDLAGARWWR